MHKLSDKILMWVDPAEVEESALQQIRNCSELPFIFMHVAVMPDCHYGKGATVGTVIATRGAIVPAAVGVDIGCGMTAVRTPLKRSDIKDCAAVRSGIERRIPMGAGTFHRNITDTANARINELESKANASGVTAKHYTAIDGKWSRSVGTLGGGNHFVELAEDQNGDVWATLHSGSRGIGNRIGNHYIKLAQDLCKKWHITLPDRDLAYLIQESKDFGDYWRDLQWAQHFAKLNRDEMMDQVMTELSYTIHGDGKHMADLELERVASHHNYTQQEHHFKSDVLVTRKGAICARKGMRAMIPGSMGTRSYIVDGLENPLSFNSAPHGAGRRMSRTQARKMFCYADLETAMEGIEFRRAECLIDEIPGAYKDIDQVMENAKDLVEIKYTLKQFVNMKGD